MKSTTRKNIYNFADRVYSFGYCEIQNITRYANRNAYNAGVYGWNFGVYYIYVDGMRVALCTGYRNMPGANVDKKITEKYNAIADEISNENKSYTEIYNDLEKLRENFAREIISSRKA